VHLEATLEQVAPVRALTEVVGKSRERWPEVGPGGHAHERRGNAAADFLHPQLDAVALDCDRRIGPR
jgi:hypothetical protein